MEYYILKCYQKEKKNCPEVEQGFDRFESKVKIIVIVCFVLVFAALMEIIVTTLLFPKQLWYLMGITLCAIAMLILWRIDSKDQKEHMNAYVDSYKKKIEILKRVLAIEFNINTKEKVEALINIYQEYVDKRKEKEGKRNGIIITFFSAFAGILAFSFENMGLIGIDFAGWIYLATLLFIFVSLASLCIYFDTLFDSLRGKYEVMVKDLNELLLMEY